MLSFFPRDVLDEIWDLIGSVSEGFFYLLFSYYENISEDESVYGFNIGNLPD